MRNKWNKENKTIFNNLSTIIAKKSALVSLVHISLSVIHVILTDL